MNKHDRYCSVHEQNNEQNALSLWTLSVQFSNGFNDLVSAFLHRIWGNCNSTIGESLIGPERVLHDHWACILDLGEKMLFWPLHWNEALLYFPSIYMMVMSHKKTSGNCEDSHLVLRISERTEAKELWQAQGSPGVLPGLGKGIVWAWCPERQHPLLQPENVTFFSFLLLQCQPFLLPTLSISFFSNFSPIWIHQRRTTNKE